MNPANFDLLSLRLFAAAAESGSLTRAAECVCLSLSAASKRITELEDVARCKLLVRQARGISLTPAGEALLTHARQLQDLIDRMGGDLEDFASGIRGRVKVWANTSAVVEFLPADLYRFVRLHPEIKIVLEEQSSANVVLAVAEGHADVGIFADNPLKGQIEAYPYKYDRLVLLVRKGHPLARRDSVSFQDVLPYDVVGLFAGSSIQTMLAESAAAVGRVLKLRIQVRSFDAICHMVAAGLGVGVLPNYAVEPHLKKSPIRTINITDNWAARRLWIGIRSKCGLRAEAERLVDVLRAGNRL